MLSLPRIHTGTVTAGYHVGSEYLDFGWQVEYGIECLDDGRPARSAMDSSKYLWSRGQGARLSSAEDFDPVPLGYVATTQECADGDGADSVTQSWP